MYTIHDRSAELADALAQASLLSPLQEGAKSHVTVGVLDGVHRGHQQLIAGMAEAAHAAGDIAIALAFDPHPATALGYELPPLLTTLGERAEMLAALGLDILIVLPFTRALARTPAADFVEALLQHIHLAELWGGPDFALGYRREGNVPFLQRLGAERGFAVRVVEPLMWEGAPVSSSRVRDALRAGDIDQATGCLGRPYRLTGTVVHGDGRGGRLGVPTANLSPPPERLVPADGIYACLAHTERLGTYPAAANVGTRPTFGGHGVTVEAHLIDFRADLYGQTLALDFCAWLRDEVAFSNVDALMVQIQKDIAQARNILGDAAH
ncbi:MAG: bifunctional riboflavin kinase/FAD synthetase [Anaerolineae bacterium]|nr:bifunctional riboflavin kinase/FAD synthetase [Anaerolineae bacterium]